ncbi:MAG TPA: DNA cytosine methyltransferase, partial [Steroidobacteraceae bacterium]|nr:DNA cytosine methyltransferase [Steroidobacteraceae bacterium]
MRQQMLAGGVYYKPMGQSFAEFFAGIGLVRLAIESLGWRCVFANDIDPKKAEIYRQNFPTDELVVGDIFDLRAADIPREAELWTASFPCVDLSLAGNYRGIHGAHSGAYW